MLPYFYPEIVPLVLKPKVYRFGFSEDDREANVRAVIEAQFLSMKLHSEWIREELTEICATGGGSNNLEILKIAANIFNAKVRQFESSNSAALGAALRSSKSYYDSIGKIIEWSELVSYYLNQQKSIVVEPKEEYVKLYEDMLKVYKKCESFILENGEDPEDFLRRFKQKYFEI